MGWSLDNNEVSSIPELISTESSDEEEYARE
jgi:hypothetical protein